MTGFELRQQKGNELMNKIISELENRGVPFILSGYENLNASKKALDRIRKNDDITSFFVRHYPDITLIYPQQSILLEVKNSSGIERNCYENYFKLKENLGLRVYLFLKNLKICSIESLKFIPAKSRCYVSGLDIPISENVWREPRLLNHELYQKYLNAYDRAGKYTSGCSFAFIDFEKTEYVEHGALFGDFFYKKID